MRRPVTDKPRWTRKAAVLLAVAAVLTAPIVEMNRGSDRQARADRGVAPTFHEPQIDQRALQDYVREFIPFVGPVPLGDALTVFGDSGYIAQLRLTSDGDADGLSYKLHLRNAGTKPFDASLKIGVWLDTDVHAGVAPRVVRAGSLVSRIFTRPTIDPGAEADRVLIFPKPTGRPTELRVSLRLGRYSPVAQWTLPS
jgi:hypothetical protein